MGFNPIDNMDSQSVVTNPENWVSQYKEAFISKVHDKSMLDLVLPDDCLVVVGPARMSQVTTSDSLYAVGFITSISVQEQRNIQPLKALGSQRHIWSASNAPLNISIERVLFDGKNLAAAIYGQADIDSVERKNPKYNTGSWYANLEEDLYRIPFGLGIVYKNPRKLATNASSSEVVAAEYFESCVISSHASGIQAGQTMIMEQVTMLADRRVPFTGYKSTSSDN